ncbi:peptidoglycan glycosyltransferase FtsW [Alpinimonas psychrophila]|uniref:peptidoglycan glycosyltransferase FtsW n=1 Tax=Alpinimonas psychrophila TaxID=748908 RepID=UPI00248445D6|nr:putative peptidoglycan glycosyltransferase FtsW [Alpinimonas psychrophila]
MSHPPRTSSRRSSRTGSRGQVTPPPSSSSVDSFLTARINLGKVFRADSPDFFLLLGLTIVLTIMGLLMVLSASSVDSFLQNGQFFGAFGRQAAFAAIGLPVMMVLSQLPLVFWRKWALAILVIGSIAQLLVFTPLGYESGGNRNWINIAGFTAQPSEFLKLAIVIWLGVALPVSIRRNGAANWKVLLTLVPALIPIGLVLLGGDLGTVIIMGMITIGAIFFAGVKLRIILIPVALGAAMVGVMAVTSPNRMARIFSFLSENCIDYTNSCWQPLHGKWALAGGGIFGVGLGNSKAKWSWLPAADNDYIFAIIGEELGLIGAALVLVLFVLLAVAFTRIIKKANDPMVRIVTGGIMVWIVGQAFVNIGVVLGVFPVLGVPLPLLSSGGTALIASLLAIGVVLSFTRAPSTFK